ncbi:MAG: hypothetical protein WCG47_16270, partial [Dermatophilaceae bacterium]
MSEQPSGDLHQAKGVDGDRTRLRRRDCAGDEAYATTLLDLLGVTAGIGSPTLLDVAAGTGVVAVEAARRGADVPATGWSRDNARRRLTGAA